VSLYIRVSIPSWSPSPYDLINPNVFQKTLLQISTPWKLEFELLNLAILGGPKLTYHP
jgi:hypothetical protein